ncbi:hypothetical protein AB0C21_28375 [Spirillospora sp. NPDC049024]
MADLPGHALKPDPLTARTMPELHELLRIYWRWNGSPSTRTVARASEGAFSHSTAAKLLYGPSQPDLDFEYLRGCVQGCGGDPTEVQRWLTAWRRIRLAPAVVEEDAPRDGEAR